MEVRAPSRRWRYARLRRVLRPANRFALDRWVSDAGRTLQGVVLNVGCGEDARRFGRRTVRLDRHAPAVDLRADVARTLPFVSGAFDGVVCTEVLEHVPDSAALLGEVARVLKPGGRLVVSVPFVFHYHRDPEDFTRMTPDGLRVAIEAAGLEPEIVAGLGGKMTAALLLLDSVHPAVRLPLRAATLLFAPLLARTRPSQGVWSDYAPNAVAIARKP